MRSSDSLLYMDQNGSLWNSRSKRFKYLLSDLGFLYLWNLISVGYVQIYAVVQRILYHYHQQ